MDQEKHEPTVEEITKNYGPIGGPNAPPPEVLEARRKPVRIIDPTEVTTKEDLQVRLWAHAKMQKYEEKLTTEWKPNDIIASGDVEPEDLDIRSIYNFKDMHWIIYRRDGALFKGGSFQTLFHIILTAKSMDPKANNQVILCKISFAKT